MGPAGRATGLAALLILGPTAPARAQQDTASAGAATAPPEAAVLPAPPEELHPGPLPPATRLVVSRDSLIWTSHYTLAELLTEVPGVYAARTGFAGQPAPVFYGGRGAAGLEIWYDGVPILGLGLDSLGVDPGRISLFGIRRVEIERHPTFLRVYLVSERHDAPGARSTLRVLNGDFKTAGYAGLFQYRWRGGVGLDLTADYFSGKGGQGPERGARWFDVTAKADWTPSPLVSASFRIQSLTFVRELTAAPTGLVVPPREDGRTETLLRVLASSRPDRLGISAEAGLQSLSWRADSASPNKALGDRHVTRGFLGVRAASRRATADVVARASDGPTPFETELRLGWVPLDGVVLSGEARWARHEGDRESCTLQGTLGLHAGPLSAVGDIRWADAVAAPALAADTAQRTLDYGARAGFASRWFTAHAAVEWRDTFTPPGIDAFPDLAPLPPSPSATYAVADVTVSFGPLTASGWYADPVSGGASSFEPPTRGRAALTLRSKFRRTFRSGAFDLKVQFAVESWGEGTAGEDASGLPITLPGTSVAEAFLQFEIARFHAFYSLQNALRSRDGFVPGFEYPRTRQTFGVKWVFRG